MSDTDSDDFFYNQDASDEEETQKLVEDTVVDISNFQSLTKLSDNKKRPYEEDWKTGAIPGNTKRASNVGVIPKRQDGQSGSDHDSNCELSESESISVSETSDGEILNENIRKNYKDQLRGHVASPTDDTLDFLTEATKNVRESSNTPIRNQKTKRIYNINFISALEGSVDKKVNVKVTGNKTFESILPITIKTFVKSYKVPKSLQHLYKAEELLMFRAGVEVLSFSNCDSLHIPNVPAGEEALINVHIVHSSEAENYKKEYKKIRESRLQAFKNDMNEYEKGADVIVNDERFKLYEKELESAPLLMEGADDVMEILDSDSDTKDTILLVLIDKFNKKVSIPVRSDTKFMDIAERYKKIANLPQSISVTLVLENSTLDPRSTVGNEDLEDNDIIEVQSKSV